MGFARARRSYNLTDCAYDLYSQREPHEERLLLDLLCSNSEMGDGQLEDELRKSFFFGGIWHKIPGTKQPPPAIPKGAVQCGGPYWTKFELFGSSEKVGTRRKLGA